jgi:hypothetical protein
MAHRVSSVSGSIAIVSGEDFRAGLQGLGLQDAEAIFSLPQADQGNLGGH